MADYTIDPPAKGDSKYTVEPPGKPADPTPGGLERFSYGLADPLIGASQLASHMGLQAPMTGMPEFGMSVSPTADASPLVSSGEIDKTVKSRETDYQKRREAGGLTGTDWARGAGSLVTGAAITAPLMGVGGAAGGFIANISRGMGLGAAGGAISGATEPVTSEHYGSTKAAQIGSGAAVGAVAGGATGALGRAIAGNSPIAAAELVRKSYYRGVRPGATMTAPEREVYEGRVRDALDAIIDTRPGQPLPRTPEEFSTAVAKAKSAIYPQYSGMAKEAEQKGVLVPFKPAKDKLLKIASDDLQDPASIAEANRLIGLFSSGNVTPTRAEEIMKFLNERANQFDTQGTKGTGSVFREAASGLRHSLIDTMANAGYSDYGRLRMAYGSLAEIEDDVGRAAGVALRQGAPVGLSEAVSAGAAVGGEPIAGAAIEGTKWLTRWMRSPNRAISRMFDEAQKLKRSPANQATRQAAGGAISQSSPLAGMVGGDAASAVLGLQ